MFRAAVLASILLAAPGVAAAHYQAEPVAKPAESKFVLRDTIWTCGEAGCAAGKSNSRPAIVCMNVWRAKLARTFASQSGSRGLKSSAAIPAP